MVVQLLGVCKTFHPGIRALHDLSLSVAAGERLVLVGPSGCGKSTALRLLAGLDEPSAGTIQFDGEDVTQTPPRKRRVALLAQKPTLLPHLSVRDNLAFPLDLERGWWRRRPADVDLQVVEIAQALDIVDLLDRPIQQLSGGQEQRVALGRAFLQPGRLRLLDEPLGQLDAPLRWQLRREIPLLQARFPGTMIVVTHDPEEALALGDRVAVLHRGDLVQAGSGAELIDNPSHRFVAEFFQTQAGAMNFLAGIVEEGRFTVSGMSWRTGRDWPAGPGILGIRAEDVYIKEGHLTATLEFRESGPGREGWTCASPLGRLLVRPQESQGFMPGQTVKLEMKWDRAFVFDVATGARTG